MDAIGIDIGGMSAKIGLIRQEKVLIRETIPTDSNLLYEPFVRDVCACIGRLRQQGKVEKIGISSCGLIDSTCGTILYSNNIRWENKKMAPDIAKITGLPVRIANDAKCAALAEAVYGAGSPYERMGMITLGTGVGGGFICHKKLEGGSPYSDADGIFGHMTVENKGRQCTCGRRGCLEAYASATAIVKRYTETTGETLTAKEIFERAGEGRREAVETIEEFRYYLAEGLTNLVNILRPEVIVIGGGVAHSADLFLPYVNEYVNNHAYGTYILPVKIVAAKLGNDAGMIGAALL